MLRVLASEIAASLLVILIATALVFALLQAMPGGPLARLLPAGLTVDRLAEAEIAQLRTAYGLEGGAVQQFACWWREVLRGNLGPSPYYPGPHAVREVVFHGFARTLLLVALAVLLLVVTTLPLGYLLGARHPPAWARAWSALGTVACSVPAFLACLFFFYLFLGLGLEPIRSTVVQRDYPPLLRAIIVLLPCAILASSEGLFREAVATARRESRALREQDHVLAALCRGERVTGRILRGLALPMIGVLEGRMLHLLSTAVVVERVFDINGLGYISWEAIGHKDYFMILAVTLVLAVTARAVRCAARMLGGLMDPRLRRGEVT